MDTRQAAMQQSCATMLPFQSGAVPFSFFPHSSVWKGRNGWGQRTYFLRVLSEKGKQKGPKDGKSGKAGKKKGNPWSLDAGPAAKNAAKKRDNVWSMDDDGSKVKFEQSSRVSGRDAGQDVPCHGLELLDGAAGNSMDAPLSRLLVSASLLTKIEAVLQPEEMVVAPLWRTFASSVSGVWRGVGAAFSPITAEMEAMSLGDRNEYLYDARILCTVESDEANFGLKRKVLWKVDNPHGERNEGDVIVQAMEDDYVEDEAGGGYRGESGGSFFLAEMNSAEGLVEELEPMEQDMASTLDLVELDEEEEALRAASEIEWEPESSEEGEEGALELPEDEISVDQLNAMMQQSEKMMDKQWEDGWDAEDSTESFGGEGPALPSTSLDKEKVVEQHASGVLDVWDDVMEEDLMMGQEDGLVFFEDGSYSRGPLKILPEATPSGYGQYAVPPTFKVEQCLVWSGHRRMRVVHTISIEDAGEELLVLRVVAYDEEWLGPASLQSISQKGGHELPPFSQRPRLSPHHLSGQWKLFEVVASVIHPSGSGNGNVDPSLAYSCSETSITRGLPTSLSSSAVDGDGVGSLDDVSVLWLPGGVSASVDIAEGGVLKISAGWLLDDGTRICIERSYDPDGTLLQVSSKSEVKSPGWRGGRM